MERMILEGTVYKHFKGKEYIVVCIAKHTETGERLVIYRDREKGIMYARPYEMFASEVDRKKYPNVVQKYRFEEVKWDTWSEKGEL